MNKIKILVVCTGNSCRSQMAEGFLKHFLGDSAEVFSAGVESHGVNPRAVQVMAEMGIDLSSHSSNLIGEYADWVFDYVITVCDNARERCPYFPAQTRLLHQNFPDPARAVGSEAAVTEEFRRVRDLIKSYCKSFVQQLKQT